MLPPDAQEDLRRRVVAAVRGGMSKVQAARIFKVSRQSIHNWMKAVGDGGLRALQSRRRGPKTGSGCLAPDQQCTLRRQIVSACPDQLRLPFALWTREAVCDLARQQCDVSMSVWTAGRYLAAWNLTPQKPLRRAYERDPKSIRRWLKQEYPAIAAQAKQKKAEIHWGDEMGLRSDHQTGTSYSPRGVTPVISGTGKRFRCNMISTVTNRGSLSFMVFGESFTTPVFIRFLKRLTRQVDRTMFLIVDRHPVHMSAAVRRWVEAHRDRLEMFFLPPYAPELNPDELLNHDVKSNALGRRRPRDRREMIDGVRSYLRGTQRRPAIVARYFQEQHVQYAAAA